MAFIDDARHSGRPIFASNSNGLPRQFYTLAVLGTSLTFWAILIVVLTHI